MQNDNSWKKQTRIEFHVVGKIDDVKHPKLSIAFCEQALADARKANDHHAEGACLLDLGYANFFNGQVENGIKHYDLAIKKFREIGDRPSEAKALGRLGSMLGNLGQDEIAIVYLGQSLTILRETGDRLGEGNCLCEIGQAYFELKTISQGSRTP